MKKHFITIIDLNTGTRQELLRSDDVLKNTIEKELGGWNNITTAMISQNTDKHSSYCSTGFTKDNTKAYSIISLTVAE